VINSLWPGPAFRFISILSLPFHVVSLLLFSWRPSTTRVVPACVVPLLPFLPTGHLPTLYISLGPYRHAGFTIWILSPRDVADTTETYGNAARHKR